MYVFVHPVCLTALHLSSKYPHMDVVLILVVGSWNSLCEFQSFCVLTYLKDLFLSMDLEYFYFNPEFLNGTGFLLAFANKFVSEPKSQVLCERYVPKDQSWE